MAMRQLLGQEELESNLSPVGLVLSILVPGYAFRTLRLPFLGTLLASIYITLLLVFIIRLGYPESNFCFGLMVALHAVSIFFLARARLIDYTFPRRVLASAMILIATWGIIYIPAQRLLQKVIMPLRTKAGAFVVHTSASAPEIKMGDNIAYRINSFRGDGYYVKAGFGIGKVQARAGDIVRFTPEHLEVNGKAFTRHPEMPTTGELVVPPRHWFVWPDIAMTQQGRAAQFQANDVRASMGMVSEEAFTGRVFGHWFWRKQEIP